ncbi:hypothetical protein ILYODFUR_016431 [Ilyodon furcidens]|uniref:Uncharacterized protein n=1 Tax=Ilyodon furcidens TaxID=33524 RepID=A0ABV0TM22_9TELE
MFNFLSSPRWEWMTLIISQFNMYSEEMPLLVLGHTAEEHGEHYLGLAGSVCTINENKQEAQQEFTLETTSHQEHENEELILDKTSEYEDLTEEVQDDALPDGIPCDVLSS